MDLQPTLDIKSVLETVGTKLTDEKTLTDALISINANFTPQRVDNYYLFGDQAYKSGKCEIIRSDNGKSLGTMGEKYNMVSNQEAFSVLADIVKYGHAVYDRGGEVKDKYFLSVKLPICIAPKCRPNDLIEMHFTGFNSFNGDMGLLFTLNATRKFGNTMFHALLSNLSKVRHSAKAKSKLDESKAHLDFISKETNVLQAKLDLLCDIPCKEQDVRDISSYILKVKDGNEATTRGLRKIDKIVELFYDKSIGNLGETRYDAFVAFNGMIDHFSTNKETTGGTRDENRFESSLTGENSKLKLAALEVLLPN